MSEKRIARQTRRERRAAARASARSGPAPAEPESADIPPTRDAGDAPESLFTLSRRDTLAAIGLTLLVTIIYVPALSGDFVWDDVIFAEEPVIHRWSGLWNIWFSPADISSEGHYWPVVYTTFWLEHKLWGLAPLGYHVVNVLLHAANVVLLWRLLAKLAVPGALAVAAVFAVHPLHVESVAWIIERKDLLSALFYLSAVLVWIRFTEAPRPGRYCLALGLFTLGLLSKSIVVTLPAALLIWSWWKKGEVTRFDALRLTPFFLVGLCITLADLAFYTSRESLSLGYSAADRVLIAARALWFYVGKLVWPSELAVIYPLWEIRADDPLGWVFVAAAATLAALLWRLRHRFGRGPLVGATYFAVTLSPALGFIDFGYMQFSFVADRFQYLAGIGVMAVLVGGAVHGASRLPDLLRFASTGAFVVVLAILGTLTWQQAGIYKDEFTFFGHIVSLNPEARDAHLNLGGALFDAGRIEEGLAASLVAVEQRPDGPGAHANLGRAMLLTERFEEADEHLSRALELDPSNQFAWQNVAELRRKQGQYDDAVEWFGKVLARDASNALAQAGLGVALYELKRYEPALDAMDRAIELEPDLPQARTLHVLAGRALRELGRPEEAERQFLRAAGTDSRDVTPLVELWRTGIAQQRFDEADVHLRRALEVARGSPEGLQIIAEALRKQGSYEESIDTYRAVLALDPEFAMAHAGMGDSLFRLERYEAAIESLGRSVDLHPHPPTATARLILMGTASAELDRTDAAATHYQRAVEIEPGNTDALDHLAKARFEAKRYAEALDLYRALLEIQPESAQTHSNLGATLFYLGRPEDALASFERAVSLDPGLEIARSGRERLKRSLRDGSP